VIFHPVLPDARVHYPANFKRFEIPMFAFAKDNLSRQVILYNKSNYLWKKEGTDLEKVYALNWNCINVSLYLVGLRPL